MKIYLLLLIILISSCDNKVDPQEKEYKKQQTSEAEQVRIKYTKFNPSRIENYEVQGFDIEEAYRLDSIILLSAYSHGDLETSSTPDNWGDRLIMIKNGTIHFQSKPVGDPYQYEPFFYRNSTNNKIIIICQLGNEENYGGEVFVLEDGEIEFMGKIEIENPLETPDNTGLIEIIRVSEIENSIYLDFESDSLIDLTNDDWIHVKNDSIRYLFENHAFTLIGL
ncbi:MAG: hypothetical protein ACJASQ_001021 [Crocinitomicaceae bacterium]|jgi:hypothetical protein